ncbi:hypothetical protein LXL04_006695 [Taraxacum kok-saghyz]
MYAIVFPYDDSGKNRPCALQISAGAFFSQVRVERICIHTPIRENQDDLILWAISRGIDVIRCGGERIANSLDSKRIIVFFICLNHFVRQCCYF